MSLFVLLVYIPALSNGFVNWDDYDYVRDNAAVRSLDFRFMHWAFLGYHNANWHPLAWISHAIDYKLWGLIPAGHHLTSVVLHAFNTFLVVMFCLALLRKVNAAAESPQTGRKTIAAAAIAGLIFGLHPIHVESVAWISERKDVLCALFYLAGLISHIRYTDAADSGSDGRKCFRRVDIRRYAYTLVLFVFALMSKPMAISFPFILLILDWYPLGRFRGRINMMRVLSEKLPFISLSFVSGVLTISAQKSAIGDLNAYPLSDRLLTAFKALFVYLCKMALPFNLSPFYSYPVYGKVSLFSPGYLVPVIIVTATTIACFAVARSRPAWLALWGCYAISLLPVLGIVQAGMQAMADRYMYLPGIGPILLFAAGTSSLYEKAFASGNFSRRAALAFSVVLIISLSAATIKQTGIWKDSAVLWSRAIELNPKTAYFAYKSRGSFYLETGRGQDALADFNKAALYSVPKPDKALLYRARAAADIKLGRYDDALNDFDTAIALDPKSRNAYSSRGKLKADLGRFDDALADYSAAIGLKSDSSEAYVNRGLIYLQTGRNEEALRDFTTALSLDPATNFKAYSERAIVNKRMGRYEAAINDYLRAADINPGSADIHYNLGNLYAQIGRYEDALSAYSKAISSGAGPQPDYFNNRGIVYRKLGREKEAQQDFLKAAEAGSRSK